MKLEFPESFFFDDEEDNVDPFTGMSAEFTSDAQAAIRRQLTRLAVDASTHNTLAELFISHLCKSGHPYPTGRNLDLAARVFAILAVDDEIACQMTSPKRSR